MVFKGIEKQCSENDVFQGFLEFCYPFRLLPMSSLGRLNMSMSCPAILLHISRYTLGNTEKYIVF